MLDYLKIGRQIAMLRKEKGYTGEKFAEILGVSPQAVSKWETGKCLPESAMLPMIAKTLSCTIDALLCPEELIVTEAMYTDGFTSLDVTQAVNRHIHNNQLSICVKEELLGASVRSDCPKLLTVKYRTPCGTYYSFAMQDEVLAIDTGTGTENNLPFKLLGAYYGNAGEYASVMGRMEHLEFFQYENLFVNHETFPGNPSTDDTEYLVLVYLNSSGIHAIGCEENHILYYGENHTFLYRKDDADCILPGISRLEWGKGMECPWAGSLHAALSYMGGKYRDKPYTYEELMGISGACYRICFTEFWDFSCTDALVSYDYSTPLYRAIGYTPVWADRLEKSERRAERHAIMKDLQNGLPVLAINLRIAPEWGIITGSINHGRCFLCRTYFDREVFEEWEREPEKNKEDIRLTFDEREGYLVNDFWPFLIVHFGEKTEKLQPEEILEASLKMLVSSFNAERTRGYFQGKMAYEMWLKGLAEDTLFDFEHDNHNALRRLCVNESMLLNLYDARRCAGEYLKECAEQFGGNKKETLLLLAKNYDSLYHMTESFYQEIKPFSNAEFLQKEENPNECIRRMRLKEMEMLKKCILIEEENVKLVSEIYLTL